MTTDIDPDTRDAMIEFDANREEIDKAYEQFLRKQSEKLLPPAAQLRGMFYAGVGFVMLKHIQRDSARADVSQQIVDAIRAIGKAKP